MNTEQKELLYFTSVQLLHLNTIIDWVFFFPFEGTL